MQKLSINGLDETGLQELLAIANLRSFSAQCHHRE